jgi:hypothetical protein
MLILRRVHFPVRSDDCTFEIRMSPMSTVFWVAGLDTDAMLVWDFPMGAGSVRDGLPAETSDICLVGVGVGRSAVRGEGSVTELLGGGGREVGCVRLVFGAWLGCVTL